MTIVLLGCNNQSGSEKINRRKTDTISNDKKLNIINDTIDFFRKAVDSLANIDYFISGQDSVVVSKDPTDFIEMNGIRYCFENPFDKSDTGLAAYRQVENVRKFHVAKNKRQNGKSANIIQISFADNHNATKWFDRLNSCKEFEVIKMKPKTEIWSHGRYVYFIQSYYDSDRQVLNTILSKFKENVD
ncbi:MAG: hypothetical protein H7Y00_10995 [Fimbriimonadaceae bacterium]|nr:hypothetical protein [Chitinophagales bacterium]